MIKKRIEEVRMMENEREYRINYNRVGSRMPEPPRIKSQRKQKLKDKSENIRVENNRE